MKFQRPSRSTKHQRHLTFGHLFSVGTFLVLLSSAAHADVELRKIGDPIFNVTGQLVEIPVGNPSGGNHSEVWRQNIDNYFGEIIDGNVRVKDNCWYCPTKVQNGPYDQEIQQSFVDAGVLLTDTYLRDDIAYPSTLIMQVMVTPNSQAPNGPSFSNPNGPILPTSIFPLERQADWIANGSSFFDFQRSNVFALDGQSLQHTDEYGNTHDLDYTGLNYSHVAFNLGYHSPSRPWGFHHEMSRVGNHEVVGQVLDVDGNGWELTSRITVVAEPTDIVGDLNYSGALDLGDYNVIRQNLGLGSTHERLDINGDDSVSAADLEHFLSLLTPPTAASLTVGESYSQDFDSLGADGAAGSVLPNGWAVQDRFGGPTAKETNAAFPTSRRDIGAVHAPHALNVGLPEGEGVKDRSLAIYKPRNTTDTSGIQLLADTDTQASALKIDFSVEAWDRIRSTAGNRDGGEAAFNVSVEIDGGDGTSDVSKILGGEFTELVNLGTVTTGAKLPRPEGDYLDGNDPAHRVAFASDVRHADIPAGSRLRFRWETTGEADASEEWIFGIDDVSITLAAAGDTNLDGEVKFDDFLALSANFGESGGWEQGDFDGNGQVDFPDFLALSANFGGAANASVSSVPEPTAASIALFGLLGLIGFRKRR